MKINSKSQSSIDNPQSSVPRTLYIVGPTASGKSELAIRIAREIDGEIICADSRTIYKDLDVSTAKPTKYERELVAHWGLDLIEPNERFSAADFKRYAEQKIVEIQSRGCLPIIVGGTGLYIDGLLFDFEFGPAADLELRKNLEQKTTEELQDFILQNNIDMPENNKNKRYLIRAIEQGGVNKKHTPMRQGVVIIGLMPPKEILLGRIESRAQSMLEKGALQEAEWLFQTYGQDAPAVAAPFFRAYHPLIFGDQISTIEECRERDVVLNRQLAKRQLAWFKRNKEIVWFEDVQSAFEQFSKLYS
jgi:tRNA dimethylallyltransferase